MGKNRIQVIIYAFGAKIYLHKPNNSFHHKLCVLDFWWSVRNRFFKMDDFECSYDLKECFYAGVRKSELDETVKK